MFEKIIDAPTPNFKTHRLSVRLAGLMGSRLLLDGAPVMRKKGVYTVHDDANAEVTIRLKTSFFDCVPEVEISGKSYVIAKPLTWYQQILAWLPLALVAQGPIVPGLFIGWVLANFNMRIMHSKLPAWLRYSAVLAVIISGSFILFAVQQMLLGIFKPPAPIPA